MKPTFKILERIQKNSNEHKETQEDTCRLWQVPFTRYSWLNYFRVLGSRKIIPW